MPKELGRYDTEMQMFVEPKPLVPRINHLRFFRALADLGVYGHKPYSAPRGEYVFQLSDQEIANHVVKQSKEEALRQRIAETGSY